MSYFLSVLLGAAIMFGLPALGAAFLLLWNGKRLERARRYRTVHGTPWWIVETEQARRQRRFIDYYKDRMDRLS